MYLGDRLGWYRALADRGPLTSAELAEATGSDERYAREWLEHQAAAAYVTVDDVAAPPAERRYTLPPAHATVLADEDSLAYLAPIARAVAGFGRSIGELADAYRTGTGVSWDDMGDDAREAQADANRPMFLHALGQDLLPAAPEVHARLQHAGAHRGRRLRLRLVVGRPRRRLPRRPRSTGSTSTRPRSGGRRPTRPTRAWPTG